MSARPVFMLHGFGSTAEDMAQVMSPHFQRLDECLYLDAPHTCPLFEGKRQWFSISRRKDYLSGAVKSAAQAAVAEIERHVEAGTRVCIVGHSQGGMIAAYLCLTRPDFVQAAVCISSEMPFLPELSNSNSADARLTFLHGRDDPFICANELEAQVRLAREREIQITLKIFEGGRHEIEDRYAQCAAEILLREGSHQYERT